MAQYVLRRLLLIPPTLLGVSVIVFALLRMAPGGPEAMKFSATTQVGAASDVDIEGAVAKFRKRFLLDQPVWKQYLHYLGPFSWADDGHTWVGGSGERPWNGLLVLDLGNEFLEPSVSVADRLMERLLYVTLPLALCAVLLSYLIAIPLGIYAGVRQGTPLEVSSTVLLFLLYAVPTFWGGLLLQMVFGRAGLDWLPVLGLHDKDADQLTGWAYGWDALKHFILPVVCYSYVTLAYISRQMRVGVVEAITQDYVRTARAKGLSEKAVVLKHVLRNSLIPVITLLSSVLPILVGGSILVEYVFDIPGMGRYAYEALVEREYNVIMATTLISAVMTMLGMLVSDVLYAVVDPRIRYD